METVHRIICPDSGLNKEKRIETLFEEIKDWVYSEALKKLICLFGGKELADSLGDDFNSDIERLHDFAEIWDFRKGKERWHIEDEQFVLDNEELIQESARCLGLKDIVTPDKEADYILPLGGARSSNHVRPLMSKKIIDDHNWSGKKILALSGTRPISDVERPFVDEYAPEAETEFDAINRGLELTYDLDTFTEKRHDDENINLCSSIRKYDKKYRDCEIYSLAAPSSEPEKRRANSVDTFKFLLDEFHISPGDKLLLITSCIYVPFQSLRFMDMAIDNGFEADCLGSDILDNFSLRKPSNYLQEIKGTVDAVYVLSKKYMM